MWLTGHFATQINSNARRCSDHTPCLRCTVYIGKGRPMCMALADALAARPIPWLLQIRAIP